MTELQLRPAAVRTGLDFALEGFLLSREAMRCTPKTIEHYRYPLGSFTAYVTKQGIHGVADITPHDIRAYLVSLQRRGLKDTTQHIHARGIRAWLNWLVLEGELNVSPMRRVAMPRLEKRIPPPFSPQEVQTLLAACDRTTELGARDYAIILTLLDTGLRAAEFCSLRVGDLDMRSGLCTVLGKGSKQRTVRVGAKARGAIVKMLALRGEVTADGPLWATRHGRPLGHPRDPDHAPSPGSRRRRYALRAAPVPTHLRPLVPAGRHRPPQPAHADGAQHAGRPAKVPGRRWRGCGARPQGPLAGGQAPRAGLTNPLDRSRPSIPRDGLLAFLLIGAVPAHQTFSAARMSYPVDDSEAARRGRRAYA